VHPARQFVLALTCPAISVKGRLHCGFVLDGDKSDHVASSFIQLNAVGARAQVRIAEAHRNS